MAQLRSVKRRLSTPTEEREQPPPKRVDYGSRLLGISQESTPISSATGQEGGSQISVIPLPYDSIERSMEAPQDNKDVVMKEKPTTETGRLYEEPVSVTPAGELWDNVKPPHVELLVPVHEPEDLFGLDESDESEPEVRRKKKGKGKQKKNSEEAEHEHVLSFPGPIPPFWGTRASEAGFPERDNTFRLMLDRGLYASPYSNNVYAGRTAMAMAEKEAATGRSAGPPPDHHVYQCVTHGMPMTGNEVNRLLTITYNRRVDE